MKGIFILLTQANKTNHIDMACASAEVPPVHTRSIKF